MERIGLIDVDGRNYPNLALMKIARFHKLRGDHWKHRGSRFLPHCQPYLDFSKQSQVVIPQWQKDLASWANKKMIFRICEFKDFEPRKGFKCKEYFL